MKILLVEDNARLAGFLVKGLRENGHTVDHADNGRDGLFLASTETYDTIVMDRVLPGGIEGLGIVEALRQTGNKTPILILSALGEVDDRIRGLRAGGDDYLAKPFSFQELIARLEAIVRRGREPQAVVSRLTAGSLSLDLLSRTATRNGRTIDLLNKEYQLLEYLIRHQGQIVTRTMLLEAIWDYGFNPGTNVIDVHVSRLRTKIDVEGEPPMIRTIRGAGYRLDAV